MPDRRRRLPHPPRSPRAGEAQNYTPTSSRLQAIPHTLTTRAHRRRIRCWEHTLLRALPLPDLRHRIHDPTHEPNRDRPHARQRDR